MQVLADYISTSKHLQHLELCWVKTPQKAWPIFTAALRENTRLRSLTLSGNCLSCDAQLISHLFWFIAYNQHLTHLDLSYCSLGAKEIRKLVKAVGYSGALLSAHFCNNPGISWELVTKVKAILQVFDQKETKQKVPVFQQRKRRAAELKQLTSLSQSKVDTSLKLQSFNTTSH